MSGLTEAEAKSFHRTFIASFVGFTVIAALAHFAVWQWRPWLPGVNGYTASTMSAPALDNAAVAVITK